MRDETILRVVCVGCIAAVALVYDGEIALIGVGAIAGLMASHISPNGGD